MATAVLELPEQNAAIVEPTATPATVQAGIAHLARHQFQPGHAPLPGAGRPKGSRNAETILRDALPLKARQWVRSVAPAVLIDARKLIIPDEQPLNSSSLTVVIVESLRASVLSTPSPLPTLTEPTLSAIQNPQITMQNQQGVAEPVS